jgi:hypothetical protein
MLQGSVQTQATFAGCNCQYVTGRLQITQELRNSLKQIQFVIA